MYRSGTALLIKLRHCFISITKKNKILETTQRKLILVIMTITKTSLSMITISNQKSNLYYTRCSTPKHVTVAGPIFMA